MSDRDERSERAREDIEALPGETALGNPDPAAPSQEDPGEYEAEHTGQYGERTPRDQASS